MSDSSRAKEIIEANRYLTLGTMQENGDPWLTPMFYAYDADYTLYFSSTKDSFHGINIQQGQKAMAVIFDSNQPEGSYQAVYMKGKVQQVPSKELTKALEVIYRRKMHLKSRVYETTKHSRDFQGDSPARLFKFTPQLVWTLAEPVDQNGHMVYKRVLVELT